MTTTKMYSLKHRIPYYECDASGHLTFSTLISLLILSSEKQNRQLGVDEQRVLQFGGGWVIIDYEAHFSGTMPKENDQIVIDTSVLAYNKYFVVRSFIIKNAVGNQIGDVKGLFVYMDLQKRRLAKIPEEIMAPYEMGTQIRLPKVAKPDRVTIDNQWHGHQYRVRYFDIDYNGHVNNACYFDWMLDTLTPEFLKTHQISAMRMNYEHEVRTDTVVDSQSLGPQTTDQGEMVTQHQILVDGQKCASATFTWKTN